MKQRHLTFAVISLLVGACAKTTPPARSASVAKSESETPKPPTNKGGEMVFIKGGKFNMGASDDDADKPMGFVKRHSVKVSDFWLDRTEVTVAAYHECVADEVCDKASKKPWIRCNEGVGDREDHPINCVSATQAATFCKWAGKRLPSEEQWEFAAAGGSEQRKYPWGSAAPTNQPCWDRRGVGTCITTVDAGDVGVPGAGDVSRDGVLGLAGNVSEWTSTADTSLSDMIAVHGGSWATDGGTSPELYPANRSLEPNSMHSPGIGFRCAFGGKAPKGSVSSPKAKGADADCPVGQHLKGGECVPFEPAAPLPPSVYGEGEDLGTAQCSAFEELKDGKCVPKPKKK